MSVIDDYLADLEQSQKEALERIRAIVKDMLPDVEETTGYGMPAFKYKGQPVVYFAAFKDHLSLFPTSGPTDVLKDQLKDFVLSKGTIQFTVEHQLPESVIRDIIALRRDAIEK